MNNLIANPSRAAKTGILAALCLALILCSWPGGAQASDSVAPTMMPEGVTWKAEKIDLPAMVKRTTIKVGTVYSYSTLFFMPDGQKAGFEYRLLKDYEKALNAKRKKGSLPVTVVFIPMPYDKLLPALVDGHIDIAAAGLTITQTRSNEAAFTDPYITGVDELVVTHKSVTNLKKLKDLSGRRIYVRPSSSYQGSLKQLNKRFKKEGLKPMKLVAADESLSTADVLEMVNAGIEKITVVDDHLAELWSTVLPDIAVHENLKLRTGGKIAWMIRQDCPKLKASLNNFIAKHKKGTKLGNIYFQRYFKDSKLVKNPLTAESLGNLAKYSHLIKKYCDQYEIDWMVIAALGYYESGWNPKAKSHAGAIGLLQLMPSLAKDKRVGIGDLHKPENNIHAGVKYLSILRDSYFNQPDLTPTERMRFALAAYNAGPTRVEQVRNLAGKMGYNPDLWFLNCEVAAQKMVGRETVRYVRNINIYYVALRQAENQMQAREKAMPDEVKKP